MRHRDGPSAAPPVYDAVQPGGPAQSRRVHAAAADTWTYFYLYVLDVFRRYVVGWMVAPRESAALVERLIEGTCAKQRDPPGATDLLVKESEPDVRTVHLHIVEWRTAGG